jgi:RNA polymerase sigma-70 factor (ECF subfamily)
MNEDKIIKQCQRYDMSAYNEIFQRYEQPLLRIALRILGNQQDAEDAVQTTFLKLYRGIKNFRFNSKFSTYLFRILINNCFDRLREKKRMKLDPLEQVEPSYTSEPGVKFQLEKAIDALPPQKRTCFVLFAIEDFKQTEIAEILNMKIGTVKSNIFYAKTLLRAMLSKVLNEENHEL